MSAEPTTARCPKCGAPVPDSAAEGLCPRCLLAAAAAPTEAGQSSGAHPVAPPLARVAAAFPQLELIELIGTGGMGAVFKARQPKLDRYVALKVLPEALAKDPAFAERFQREGRVLARLNHPNIVTVHDFGQAGGIFYLLMEYVDGVNLRQAMRAGRFTPAQALALVPRICEALQFAHDEGVLHRDIKPENILLDARGRVKIADVGIAKLVGETRADVGLTATGAAMGTPHYMAPEQIEHPADVDHRADIYSLGVVFYELLTGELPLGRFAPPSAKTDLDARIDEIVLRALAKERELRQQTAREVKTEVEGVTAHDEVPASSGAEPEAPTPIAPLWQLPLLARQAIRALLVLVLGCLVYVVATSWSPWQRIMIRFVTEDWTSALATVLGIVAVGVLGTACWRRRAVWASPLRLPPAVADVTNRWLQALLGGLLVCVGVVFARMVLGQTGVAGQWLARGRWGFAAYSLGILLALVVPAGLLVRREFGRRDLRSPDRLPAWAHRVAVGLVLVALSGAVARFIGAVGHVDLFGAGEILVTTAIALWMASRIWRAVALAWLGVALVEMLPSDLLLFVDVLRGGRAFPEAVAGAPFPEPFATFPVMTAVCQGLGLLGIVAGLVTLLHPAVRAAFGLPPRHPGGANTIQAPTVNAA